MWNKNLPLLNAQKYTMSPHPSSLGGCSLLSASRNARVRPLSGATYFKPQASGYWAFRVESKRVPSFSNGKSTTSLSSSFVSDTWTNDMMMQVACTKRKIIQQRQPLTLRRKVSIVYGGYCVVYWLVLKSNVTRYGIMIK